MRNLYKFFATQQTFIKMFCQNTCICSETAIKTYFHFSHYKSMEILSCHSTWATAIKNINFIEAYVMNISAKFQLHAPYGFWFFNIFCTNLSFRLPWQPIKFSGLDKIHMFGRRLLKDHFWKNFCQNICSEIEIKAYFHFSHYKSTKIRSCHSDESTWATAIKKHNFVEANVMNISTKFQLYPPYGFWGEDFLIFFVFRLPWQPIKFWDLDKIHMVGRGPFKEHFCKTFVKISAMR